MYCSTILLPVPSLSRPEPDASLVDEHTNDFHSEFLFSRTAGYQSLLFRSTHHTNCIASPSSTSTEDSCICKVFLLSDAVSKFLFLERMELKLK